MNQFYSHLLVLVEEAAVYVNKRFREETDVDSKFNPNPKPDNVDG